MCTCMHTCVGVLLGNEPWALCMLEVPRNYTPMPALIILGDIYYGVFRQFDTQSKTYANFWSFLCVSHNTSRALPPQLCFSPLCHEPCDYIYLHQAAALRDTGIHHILSNKCISFIIFPVFSFTVVMPSVCCGTVVTYVRCIVMARSRKFHGQLPRTFLTLAFQSSICKVHGWERSLKFPLINLCVLWMSFRIFICRVREINGPTLAMGLDPHLHIKAGCSGTYPDHRIREYRQGDSQVLPGQLVQPKWKALGSGRAIEQDT